MGILKPKEKDINFNDETEAMAQSQHTDEVSDFSSTSKEDPYEQVNIKKYKDPEGMTLEKMKVGFWMIRNKGYFYVLIAGILVLFSFAGWFVFFFAFGHYSIFGSKSDDMMVRGLISNTLPNHSVFASLSARDLNNGESGYLKVDDDSYDFYAKIINPNKNHWTKFTYYFAFGNDKSEMANGYILPGDSKFLFVLNQKIPRGISGKPQLIIENLNWMRVNPHQFKNWREYRSEYLNFEVMNKELVRSQDTNLSEKVPLNELKFTAYNRTAYNFHSVDFLIILMSGQEIEGVNKYTAENFKSGEIRNFNVVWPGKFGRVNDIYIEPQINAFDRENLFDFKGSGEASRYENVK